jgi:hypothetical protein
MTRKLIDDSLAPAIRELLHAGNAHDGGEIEESPHEDITQNCT